MKKSLLPLSLAFGATLFLSGTSGAAIAYDGFDYPVGATLAGQTDWVAANGGVAPVIATGNLTVTGLAPSTGNMVSSIGGNFQEAIGTLDTYNSGTVYFSVAFQLTSLPTAATYSYGLSTGTTNFGDVVYFQADGSGGFNIGVGNRSSGVTATYSPISYALNSTVFLVGSYTFGPATGDNVSNLWINPSSSDFSAASAPTATLTSTGGTDLSQVNQFLIRGAAGSPADLTDELRVGTTWASVTPTAVPEPTAMAIGALGFLAILRRRRAC
jgi:hypothetical protein